MSIEKQTIKSERLGESYFKIKHPSGLNILVWEMPEFSSVYALFGTKYGSINTKFKTKNDKDFIEVPEGIAHFLEHKLFENEDCDVFELYAKTGASGNAYTSFDQTAYLFSCTENYEESLKILLDFVQAPYFTQETVDKEQGIIGQEIRMCEDTPYRQVFFNLLRCLYVNHPVKIEIAGTVESIAKIDADLLYSCYNTFYNLNNMALAIAGNVKLDDVLAICDKHLKTKENPELVTAFPNEPEEVNKEILVQKMPVGTPLFAIGYKSVPFDGKERVKKELEASILLNLICGSTSELYKELYDEGLINSNFYTEVDSGDGFFASIFSGESKSPQEVFKRIKDEIERIKKEGIDPDLFEIIKKAEYGKLISGLNSAEKCATLMFESDLLIGVDAFENIESLASINEKDIMDCIDILFDNSKTAISIVESNT